MGERAFEELRATAVIKSRAPPVDSSWDDREGWRIIASARWSYLEHNKLGEGKGILLALRHCVRSRRNWDSRVLIITDSMVCLGAFLKGSSSSRGLLRLARQMASLAMGFGMKVALRFTPSGRNQADGPSRGHPVGVAPKEGVGLRARAPGWDPWQ
jgi:hypothetical protein